MNTCCIIVYDEYFWKSHRKYSVQEDDQKEFLLKVNGRDPR